MNYANLITLLVVTVILFFAIRTIIRSFKSGSCAGCERANDCSMNHDKGC